MTPIPNSRHQTNSVKADRAATSVKPVSDTFSQDDPLKQTQSLDSPDSPLNSQLDVPLSSLGTRLDQYLDQHLDYWTIAQLCPVGIFRTDAQGNCLYVNQRWCEISGLTAAEAIQGEWSQAVHPDDLDRLVREWQDATESQSAFRSEYRFCRSDGLITWVLGQAVAEIDNQGELAGYIGTITDITDRKQAEAAHLESEERFRATFEQAAVGIAHVDLEGRWLRVNQRFCKIVGYSKEELLQRRYQDMTHPDDLEADFVCVHQLIAGQAPTCVLEKRYLRKDGTPVWIDLTVSLVTHGAASQNPGQQYFLAVIQEITARKQAELALQERAAELEALTMMLTRTTALVEKRNQELDQFAYVASHDLKAPLRAIANLSEWLEEDLAGQLPPDNEQQLRLLRGRVHRMEALINGLLEYSRVGRIEATAETVDVNALLAEVVDTIAPPSTFTIDIAAMPTFTTKALLLRQVFTNLISNAIKHHDRSDGRVSVTVKDQGTEYEFAIADDGPGIDPEYHQKIFTIFQTLEARDTKENTGIGLSIVKKILETEGGTIRVESQEGYGSTFFFTWKKRLT